MTFTHSLFSGNDSATGAESQQEKEFPGSDMSFLQIQVIFVCSSADVGSAVAQRLDMHGHRVFLHKDSGPGHPRGMAFTDALFVGSIELEAVRARQVRPDQCDAMELGCADFLLVTNDPLQAVLDTVKADVHLSARMRKRSRAPDLASTL